MSIMSATTGKNRDALWRELGRQNDWVAELEKTSVFGLGTHDLECGQMNGSERLMIHSTLSKSPEYLSAYRSRLICRPRNVTAVRFQRQKREAER